MEKVVGKDDVEFTLYDEVWKHIREYHPEIKEVETIELILKEPDVIIKSRWDDESYLYYKQFGHLFGVVVVQMREKRIKTTLTTDKIKKGDIIWKKE